MDTLPGAAGSRYEGPTSRETCDIVMKGGITSGVVYPAAVLELKEKYDFVNVGGASAGAIAAVVTAAAEYRRQVDGSEAGFDVLRKVMRELAQDGFVQSLFQPTQETRPLYDVLIESLKVAVPPQEDGDRPAEPQKGLVRRVLPVVRVMWRRQRASRIAWALVGVAAWLATLLVGWGLGLVADPTEWDLPAFAGVAVGALVAFVLGSVVGFVLGTVRTARGVYAGLNQDGGGFGMCPGRTQPGSEGGPALTDWLYERIQECAGPSVQGPLTFGHLRERGIHLETMTTDLTLARPVRIPFEFERYRFRPADMRRIFPDPVVEHMISSSPSTPQGHTPTDADEDRLLEMPNETNIPVVAFARLSLSFPVLLSAVRLYAQDPARPEGEPMAHWLSDGGIASNFPIHFFDGWLPGRPTFGLNLGPYPTGSSAGEGDPNEWATAHTWLPTSPEESRFRRRTRIETLPAFLAQILDTMQNWRDTVQAELPGFSDRVCEIRLHADEGGMNLAMPVPTIERLMGKGAEAGERLRERFNWEQHQFTRYRMLMATLQRRLRGVDAQPGVLARYATFGPLLRSRVPKALHYRDGLDEGWFDRADGATASLLGVVERWDRDDWGDPKRAADFTIHGDLPTWVMRITPKV